MVFSCQAKVFLRVEIMGCYSDKLIKLESNKKFDSDLLASSKKHTHIAIHGEKYHISHWALMMITKNKDWIKSLEFNDCKLFEDDYKHIFGLIRSNVEELKFVKCGFEKPKGKSSNHNLKAWNSY
jgi:hypothetical protein